MSKDRHSDRLTDRQTIDRARWENMRFRMKILAHRQVMLFIEVLGNLKIKIMTKRWIKMHETCKDVHFTEFLSIYFKKMMSEYFFQFTNFSSINCNSILPILLYFWSMVVAQWYKTCLFITKLRVMFLQWGSVTHQMANLFSVPCPSALAWPLWHFW